MRIAPTLDRSLRIDAESPTDWLILEMICTDACNMPGSPLADRLGAHMKSDEDWEEIITPELSDTFSQQVLTVSRAISSAKVEDDLTGSLFIESKMADTWFGALNQARLSLEDQHDLSLYLDDEDLSNETPVLQAAMVRYNFYTTLQSLMLEYIMDS